MRTKKFNLLWRGSVYFKGESRVFPFECSNILFAFSPRGYQNKNHAAETQMAASLHLKFCHFNQNFKGTTNSSQSVLLTFIIFYLTLNPFLQCRVVHWKKIKEFLNYNLKSSLLFMDSVQLPQNCRATTRQLYLIIYHYVSFCQKLCEDFEI